MSRALLNQQTLTGLLDIGFYFPFYVSKYHIQRDDALPGGVLCDIPLYFVIPVTNILEIVFGSPDCAANKTHVYGFGASLNNSYVGYEFCCVVVCL